jgi:hypothetical protein
MRSLRIDPQGSAVKKQKANTDSYNERKRRDHDELQGRLPMFGPETGRAPIFHNNAEESEVAARMFCEGFTAGFRVCGVRDVSAKF